MWPKIQIQAQIDRGQEEKRWEGQGTSVYFQIFLTAWPLLKPKSLKSTSYSNGIAQLSFCSVAKETVKR